MAPKIQLRDLTEGDLPILFAQQLNPVANLMAAVPGRTLGEFMQHWTTRILGSKDCVVRVIANEDSVFGYLLAWNQNDMHLIGYWIGQEHWGQGIATLALQEFLSEPSQRRRPLYAYVAKHNLGSIRVLEKCGFLIFKQGVHFSKVHGHEVDEYLMRLT